MTVVVAAVWRNSVAHRALSAEGVPHEEHICRGRTGYAELLVEAWRRGKGFILLEHDVVPWVGAIRELQECEGRWCSFPHAKSGRTVRSLGLIRFSEGLIRTYPKLAERWRDTPWQSLEREVLISVGGVAPMCKHLPAVGHARLSD